MNPKTVFLFSPGPFGGAEKLILESANILDVEVLIIKETRAPQYSEEFITLLKEKNISYYCFESKKRFDKPLIKNIQTYINLSKIEIVHSHGMKANFINSFLQTKRVGTQHGLTSHSFKTILMEFVEQIRLRKMEKLVCVSTAIYNTYPHPNKILIENFIPPIEHQGENQFRHDLKGRIKFMFAGRFSPEKGISFLLELAKEFPQIDFHLYGKGAMEHIITQQALKNVFLEGFVPKISKEFHKYHALIIPSQREGLPLIALEAAAANLPILASYVGGLPDLLMNSNFLFQKEDLEDAKYKINNFVENPVELSKQFEQISYRVKEYYSIDRWKDKTQSLYRSL